MKKKNEFESYNDGFYFRRVKISETWKAECETFSYIIVFFQSLLFELSLFFYSSDKDEVPRELSFLFYNANKNKINSRKRRELIKWENILLIDGS